MKNEMVKIELTEKQLNELRALPASERIAAHERLTGKTDKEFARKTKKRIHDEYRKAKKRGILAFFCS